MKKLLVVLYALFAWFGFLAIFMYMMAFLANAFVPKTVDSGEAGPLGMALAVNVGLMALFGLSHSVMARPGFKKVWTKFVPEVIERSTYVLVSNIFVLLLLWQWRPMPGVLWDVENANIRMVLWALFLAGWGLIVLASFLINHFDLFGVRQAFLYAKGQEYTPLKFGTPLFYRWVRHPLYVGWLLAFWVTPTMTMGHVLFAGGLSVYILIAIQLEERDLSSFHTEYSDYKKRVPMLIPLPFFKKK